MVEATLVNPYKVELRADGSPGVLVCEHSGVTGEWEPSEFRLHDGGVLLPREIPAFRLTLSDEALAAIERAGGEP